MLIQTTDRETDISRKKIVNKCFLIITIYILCILLFIITFYNLINWIYFIHIVPINVTYVFNLFDFDQFVNI